MFAKAVRIKHRAVRGALLFAVTAAALTGLVWLRSVALGAAEEFPQSAMLAVETITLAAPETLTVQQGFAGRVVARRESALGFERAGLLADVAVDDGEAVEKGQVLARLDTRQLDAEKEALTAERRAAEARIREAEAQLNLAKVTAKRQKTLSDAGHVSIQRYDEARFEEDAAAARLASAKSALKRTEAEIIRVDAALALSTIAAPYTGEVTARYLDEGAIASPGQAVFHIIESEALEVRVGLPLHAVDGLDVGADYEVLAGTARATARLDRITTKIDDATRTVTAVFLPHADSGLKSGQVARVRIEQALDKTGFWLPTKALSESTRGLWSVYALEPTDDGLYRLSRRELEALHVETGRAFVRGTIREGDRIVAAGVHRLAPGQLVTSR